MIDLIWMRPGTLRSPHGSGGGRDFGIAAHRSFNTYAAPVVEAEVDGRDPFKVQGIDQVVDAGFQVRHLPISPQKLV